MRSSVSHEPGSGSQSFYTSSIKHCYLSNVRSPHSQIMWKDYSTSLAARIIHQPQQLKILCDGVMLSQKANSSLLNVYPSHQWNHVLVSDRSPSTSVQIKYLFFFFFFPQNSGYTSVCQCLFLPVYQLSHFYLCPGIQMSLTFLWDESWSCRIWHF